MSGVVIDILDRVLGFYGSLMHWDTLVLDRWIWLRKRFLNCPREAVLDVGCGGGAFTIGLARLGHDSVGLTYNEASSAKARKRATWYSGEGAQFLQRDARALDTCEDLHERFDSVICLECIEHILDDSKLMIDMASCLRPGGRLILTTPNIDYIPITPGDAGPFLTEETGWHVRKGYNEEQLRELCCEAGLDNISISYCSGYLSQKITWLLRTSARLHHLFGLLIILPLRIFPPLFDPLISRLTRWPDYSICLEAHKSKEHAVEQKTE